jgi:cobalt/nickel transport system permease protein
MRAEFLDHHSRVRSPIHSIDPRVKLVVVLVFILAAATTPIGRYWDYTGLGFILVGLLLLTRIPFPHLAGKILKLFPLVLVIAIGLPFFRGGTPVVTWNVLGIDVVLTREGLHLFANVLCKATLAVGAMVLLSSTTTFPALLNALERFRVPSLFISMLSVMYRYLFVFFCEKERLLTARRSRMARPPWSLKWKSLAQIVAVLFLRALGRGERVYQAMCSRGFAGRPVNLMELRARPFDWLALVFGLYLIGLVKYIGFRYVG